MELKIEDASQGTAKTEPTTAIGSITLAIETKLPSEAECTVWFVDTPLALNIKKLHKD